MKPLPALALFLGLVVAGCGLMPLANPPDTRVEVGPWVAFGRGEAASSPELADFVAARNIALRAMADQAGLGLTESTDGELVTGLLRIDDQGGGRIFQATGPDDPIDAWVLTFRAPGPDDGGPTEALVVVAAETGKVLMVHSEPLQDSD